MVYAPECCSLWQALADNLKKTAESGEEEKKAVLKARKKHMGALGAYVAIKRSAESSHYGAADDKDVEVADLEMKAVVAIPTAPGEEYRAI